MLLLLLLLLRIDVLLVWKLLMLLLPESLLNFLLLKSLLKAELSQTCLTLWTLWVSWIDSEDKSSVKIDQKEGITYLISMLCLFFACVLQAVLCTKVIPHPGDGHMKGFSPGTKLMMKDKN